MTNFLQRSPGFRVDFGKDLYELLRVDLDARGVINLSQDLDGILQQYVDFRRQYPIAGRKVLFESQEIKIRRLDRDLRVGYGKFKSAASQGKKLDKYLSRLAKDGSFGDVLFYDWKIEHYHLGLFTKPNGLIDRTDDLLFAMSEPQTRNMYLIDIHPHRAGFTNSNLIAIIENNWPNILDQHTLNGVLELSEDVNDVQRGQLRNAGINPGIQTPGGRVLASMGGGITCARTSVQSRIKANQAKRIVRQLEKWIFERAQSIEQIASIQGVPKLALSVHLKEFVGRIRVVETTSGHVLIDEPSSW